MKTDVAATEIARDVVDFLDLHAAGGFDRNPGAEAGRISLGRPRLDHEPVVLAPRFVVEQHGRASEIGNHHIESAVIVEVGHGQAASDPVRFERGAAFRRYITKFAADILVQQILLRVGERRLVQATLSITCPFVT